MNISDIEASSKTLAGRQTAFGMDSFLRIGKKGDTAEGTISSVSDPISINFNGIEVAVSKSAVQHAKEGETRRYQIKDVSKDSIVLKEVDNRYASSETRAQVGTSVGSGTYTFTEYLDMANSSTKAKQQADQNISVLTGEDYQNTESDEGDLEKLQKENLDRAVEHQKEKRQWQQLSRQAYQKVVEDKQEGLDKMQSLGFLDEKSDAQIAKALQEADLPADAEQIQQVRKALNMCQAATEMEDRTKAYLIEGQLPPTIDNIYRGQYSGQIATGSQDVDEDTWQALLTQIQDVIQNVTSDGQRGALGLGSDVVDTTGADEIQSLRMEQARWLFANSLPLTAESMEQLDTVEQIAQDLTTQKALQQIVQNMAMGNRPEETSLDDSQMVLTRQQVLAFGQVSDGAIQIAVQATMQDSSLVMNLELLQQSQEQYTESTEDSQVDQQSQSVLQEITVRRQLEEIRLRMTLQSAIRMADQGIDIETSSLSHIVDTLKEMERSYYIGQTRGTEPEITPNTDMTTSEQMTLLQETLDKTSQIGDAPAQILGFHISARQQELLTVNVLHRAAVSATVQMQQYQTDYEAVSTQVRSDLGDTIEKAFVHVSDLLADLGMEDTQANERAVRILGYNSMEITEDHILQVKSMDQQVNQLLEQMKPSVVLEMIRQGVDPLQTSLDSLSEKAQEITEQQGISEEEKYSRYLWQLERDDSISREERKGYIGMYRLFHNIEKSKGAAVGAVLQSGREMTLGNLLSAVRTSQYGRMDAQVDEHFGGLESLQYHAESITSQIETGMNTSYYQSLALQSLDQITPSKLQQLSDGDMEKMLDTTLEHFAEKLEQTAGNETLQEALYESKAQQLRQVVEQDHQVTEYLDHMDIPEQMGYIQVTEQMQSRDYDIQKEAYDRRKKLDQSKETEYCDIVGNMVDALESEEQIEEQSTRLQDYMEQIMKQSSEADVISSQDLAELKLLGQGIRFEQAMTQRRSYDIPIQTGDTAITMNVTVMPGSSQDNGRVQIAMNVPTSTEDSQRNYMLEDQESRNVIEGRVFADIRVSGQSIKGLVLCEERSGYEALNDARGDMVQELQDAGYEVKNLSTGMDRKTRLDMGNNQIMNQTDTASVDLYRVARIMVRQIVKACL